MNITTVESNLESDPLEILQTSEIRYRRLFESSQDGILILDPVTGRITDVNLFMIKLQGYSFKEFIGKELWEIGLLEDKEAGKSHFANYRKTGISDMKTCLWKASRMDS